MQVQFEILPPGAGEVPIDKSVGRAGEVAKAMARRNKLKKGDHRGLRGFCRGCGEVFQDGAKGLAQHY